jgi:hypothetical protein
MLPPASGPPAPHRPADRLGWHSTRSPPRSPPSDASNSARADFSTTTPAASCAELTCSICSNSTKVTIYNCRIRATRAEQPFRIYTSLAEALTANEEYPQPPAQVSLPEFMHSIANLPHAGQATICAWCHVTPWAPWSQREREYERALSCHQAHEITAPEKCSADNVVHPFGYGTSRNQPASQGPGSGSSVTGARPPEPPSCGNPETACAFAFHSLSLPESVGSGRLRTGRTGTGAGCGAKVRSGPDDDTADHRQGLRHGRHPACARVGHAEA